MFISGRLKTYNVPIIASEVLHDMRQKRISNRGGSMYLKLDISKTYDRVEWSFLEEIMKTLGFDEGWIRMVMFYVRLLSFSTMINGESNRLITPSQVIR